MSDGVTRGEAFSGFVEFYSNHYSEEIESSMELDPHPHQSLQIEWDALAEANQELASSVLEHPDAIVEYAESALEEVIDGEIQVDETHVRITDIPDDRHLELRNLEYPHRGELVTVTGLVSSASDPQTKLSEVAFECQRCGTLTYIEADKRGNHNEPYECQGCERQGPFAINHDQSTFDKLQEIAIREFMADVPEGEDPTVVGVYIEDDLTGEVSAGDAVKLTGIPRLTKDESADDPVFNVHFDGHVITPTERPDPPDIKLEEVSDINEYVTAVQPVLTDVAEEFREEETKAKLVTPFVEALGWNKFDHSEVRLEYTDSKTDRRVDYALFTPKNESPAVVIEAKQFNTVLEAKEEQIYDYLRTFDAKWGVLTNGEEFYIYQNRGGDDLPTKSAELSVTDLAASSIVESLTRSDIIAP